MSPSKLAAPQAPLTPARYRRLLADLRRLLDEGRQRAEEAVAHHLVATYHAIGSRLLDQQLTDNAGYGDATVGRLADELAVGRMLLYRAMALARAYPDGPPESGLRWSHYRELLAVANPRARAWYETEAREQGWTATKLVQSIRAKRADDPALPQGKRRRPKAKAKALKRPAHPMHVYKARVIRVVDGDTLLTDVDLGFQVHKEQRLRLAGIDTPPLDSPSGAKASAYVLDRLAEVEFVVVWTVKIDLYGRYVAHVFYQPGESDKRLVALQGKYLNQELVNRGLAKAL
jgi:micrococcal nuclease